MLHLDESANEREIVMPVGETFELRLPENRTTGFSWSLGASGQPACRLLADRYEAAGGGPGRGGSHFWQFEVVQAGAGSVHLAYHRPWEHDTPPARTFTLYIIAQPGRARGDLS